MKYLILIAILFCAPAFADTLIIGDSVSIGYMPFVQQESQTIVTHIPGNAKDTFNTLANINEWLSVPNITVIHYNNGLWDAMRGTYAGIGWATCDLSKPTHSSLKEYRNNLEKIASILESTGAQIVWATTTPVPYGNKCVKESDILYFNKILRSVAREHGFEIDELFSLMLPYQNLHAPSTGVHYTEEGYQLMSYQVNDSIR